MKTEGEELSTQVARERRSNISDNRGMTRVKDRESARKYGYSEMGTTTLEDVPDAHGHLGLRKVVSTPTAFGMYTGLTHFIL